MHDTYTYKLEARRRRPILGKGRSFQPRRLLGVAGFTLGANGVRAVYLGLSDCANASDSIYAHAWFDTQGQARSALLRQQVVLQPGASISRNTSGQHEGPDREGSSWREADAGVTERIGQTHRRASHRNSAVDGYGCLGDSNRQGFWHRSNECQQYLPSQELEASSVVRTYSHGRQRASRIPCGVLLRTRPPKAQNSMERSND